MKRFYISLLLGLVVLVFTAPVLIGQADEGTNPGRERGRRFGEGGSGRSSDQWRARREGFQRRMTERLRELLEASDEDWAVLQPRIEKVTQLQRGMRDGMRLAFGFGGPGSRGRGGGRIESEREGRRGGGPGGADAVARERSDIELCSEALQDLLEDEATLNDQITEALTALRKARETARVELEQAQGNLRDLCTLKQEARLVMLRILD